MAFVVRTISEARRVAKRRKATSFDLELLAPGRLDGGRYSARLFKNRRELKTRY